MTRRAPLVLFCTALLAAARARGADCDGGAVMSMRLGATQVSFTGTVTRRGVTPQSFVGGDGLRFQLVDANDPTAILFELNEPAAHFLPSGSVVKYDKAGAFDGSIVVKPEGSQADTVRVTVKSRKATLQGLATVTDVRAVLTTGAQCAHTCVSTCEPRGSGTLRCDQSLPFEPPAAEGYGVRNSQRTHASSFCGLAVDAAPGCDFLIAEQCVLPYPSSHFLASDATTATRLRVRYGPESLPRSATGVPIDPTDWNTLDGFSPGSPIIALFPDTGFPVDLTASHVAFHTDFARSLEADHPTVILDAATGARVLHFAELDANTADVARRAFIIRPGRRLQDGHRYLVGIRNLVDTQGSPIRPRLAFRALHEAVGRYELARACGEPCAAAIFARRPLYSDILARFAAADVDPNDLILAWDFTTASSAALTGWIVAVRDKAFALPTPTFTVTKVDDGAGNGFNADTWVRIEGTFQAPLFMTADAPASRLKLVSGVPTQNGNATVPYVVDIPRSAVNPGGTPKPARASLWGHGLLGDRYQLGSLAAAGNQFNMIFAAVDMQGMSAPDVPAAILPLSSDLSLFHYIPERLHQGFLNHLLLGRLLADPVAGFNKHAAFQFGQAKTPIIDTTQVFYSGGSQGGILGLAIMAVAPNFPRGFLAVPAANFSTLLSRSTQFRPFKALLDAAYPDPLDEQVLLGLVQQLWDRAEPQGYLPHLLAGTLSNPPVPHKILIQMATYDSQVTNIGTEIAVRSLGIPQVGPVRRSFFQIPEMTAPYDGSAFVEIDNHKGGSRCNQPGADNPGASCTTDANCPGAGDLPVRTRCDSGIPPAENLIPPFENGAHGSASANTAPMAQVDAFLRKNGRVENSCTGPCDPN